MTAYRSTSYIPPLVRRAINLANQMQIKTACTDSIGRLLQLMVNQYQSGVIAEIGTGCGCGAAWIISALSPGCSFVTVEEDAALAAVARALFENYPNVRVMHGKWQDILFYKPFGFVYLNINLVDESAREPLLQSLRIGGTIVLSGMVPQDSLPVELRQHIDPVRDFWLNDPRLLATELPINQAEALVVASRVG